MESNQAYPANSARCQNNLQPKHLITGKKGEEIARAHLQSLGLKIYAQNVRLGRDEIDIIAYDPDDKVLVFVEVKTRKRLSDEFRPEFNFTHFKKRKLFRAARKWVSNHEFEDGYRVDLVCVAGGKVIDHFRGITF